VGVADQLRQLQHQQLPLLLDAQQGTAVQLPGNAQVSQRLPRQPAARHSTAQHNTGVLTTASCNDTTQHTCLHAS
jgi:hypothetical protein